MSAKVKTRCPLCAAQYDVRTSAVGHRARCAKCNAVFRVAPLQSTQANETGPPNHTHQATINDRPQNEPPKRFPTEEDVLRWLNEADNEDEVAVRPRIISDATRPLMKHDASQTTIETDTAPLTAPPPIETTQAAGEWAAARL